MKTSPLLTSHLEGVSGAILEKYPEIIKGMIRGRHGVYALYRGSKLYYVGLAKNLMARLKQHLKDRHQGKWNRFSVFLTAHFEHIKELESLLIRIALPSGNRVSGRFAAAQNLLKPLQFAIEESNDRQVAQLLGGKVAKKLHKSKALRNRGREALEGFATKSIPLVGTANGKRYRATLRPDGRIRIRSKVFDSPSKAARYVLHYQKNGWRFWHHRNDKGDWVPIENIKK